VQAAGTDSWSALQRSSPCAELPYVEFSEAAMILLPGCAVAERLLPAVPEARFAAASELPAIADRFRRAKVLIDNHSPGYTDWIGRAITFLAPTQTPYQGSGSNPSFPGLVVMSNDPRPQALMEMMVHEASHQFFFMATLLGRVDDGSDTQQHYSPLVGRNRPIDKVLLSFHALGNMTILMRDCIETGIDDEGYCRQRLVLITEQLRRVEEVLQRSTALTGLGKALWQPLAERLAQTAQ
jgi:HEXXH motif-containing protein